MEDEHWIKGLGEDPESLRKPTASQQEFFDDDKHRLLHFSGGYGSGKTTILCAKILKLSMLNKDVNGGLVFVDFTEYYKDLYPALASLLENNGIPFHENKGKHTWEFPWTNGKLFAATAKKKIRGPNWGYAGINELTLIPLIRYQEVISRVRVKTTKVPQIVSNGTPEGYDSEYHEYLIEKPPANTRVIYGSTRENADNMEAGYIASLESAFDSTMQSAYIDGQWVIMTGDRFYYNYKPDLNEDKSIVWDPRYHIDVTMDFNVDPMTCAMWQQTNTNRVQAFDEIVLEGGSDTNKMAVALKQCGYTPDRVTIYPDPSGIARSTKGQPDITILEQHGFVVEKRSTAPPMRRRQLNANNLFERRVVVVNPIACPWLAKDCRGVKLDKSTLEKDKKNPKMTHLSDGMDYYLDIKFPFSGTKPNTVRSSKVR